VKSDTGLAASPSPLITMHELPWSQLLITSVKTLSLIITNMELKFEPCVLNFIWKCCAKDPKKREDHLIFVHFGLKKFIVRNTQKKKTLMSKCYNLLNPME
jgi:hypothetical protein